MRYEGDLSYPSSDTQNQRAIPPDFNKLFVVNNRSKDHRVVAIPVGAQPQRNPWRLALAPLFAGRRKLAYSNFSVESQTDPAYTGKRTKAYDAIRRHSWITFENMGNRYGEYDLRLFTYYRRVSQHRFTISPEGGGADCHRTWEALYLKSVPIVQRSPEMEHFSDLPILFTDDYSELTPNYLEEQYARMLATEYNIEKLYLSYWRLKIEEAIAEFTR